MKYNFITTFNKRLYDKYAHKFIDSYLKTNQLFDMVCYVEEDNYEELYPQHEKITYKNILKCQPECQAFVDRNKYRPTKSYIDNAVMFSYKVFAQYDASFLKIKTIFLDSDCVFHKQLSEDWINKFIPDDTCLACYTRESYYSESGFIGFNNTLDTTHKFFKDYIDLYLTDNVYCIKCGYTDSIAFDVIRRKYKFISSYKEKSWGDKYAQHGHVMATCPMLSPYVDHRKGNRKQMDRSPEWKG